MITVTSTKTASAAAGVKCAIYGKAGMGKTLLLATAPNPVIISAEKGLLTLRKYDVPVIEVRNFAEMWEAHRFLTQSHEARQFQTIGLDSASEIAEQVLSNAKIDAKDPRAAYGKLGEDMLVALKAFRDIHGKHVVMLAKEGRIKDDVTNTTFYGADFPGNLIPQAFPYLFDEIFNLTMIRQQAGPETKDVRVLRTQPDIQYSAKDRSGTLPPLIAVPEMNNGMNSGFLTAIFNQILTA